MCEAWKGLLKEKAPSIQEPEEPERPEDQLAYWSYQFRAVVVSLALQVAYAKAGAEWGLKIVEAARRHFLLSAVVEEIERVLTPEASESSSGPQGFDGWESKCVPGLH